MIIDSFSLIINNNVTICIIILFLLFSSYTDIKELKIYDKSTIAFLIIRVILIFIPQYNLPFMLTHLLGGLFGFLIFLIPAMICLLPMGGDIKLMGVLGMYLGLPTMVIFLFILCISSLIYMPTNRAIIYIKNKKRKENNIKVEINKNKEWSIEDRKKKVSKGLLIPLCPFFLFSFITIIVFSSKISFLLSNIILKPII